MIKNQLYRYKAHVVRVYDGDTCTVDIDLGLSTWVRGESIRLYGINSKEVRGAEREEGLKARDFLSSLILGKDVYIETILDKKGKYGRYIGKIYLPQPEDFTELYINDYMVECGFAEYHDY